MLGAGEPRLYLGERNFRRESAVNLGVAEFPQGSSAARGCQIPNGVPIISLIQWGGTPVDAKYERESVARWGFVSCEFVKELSPFFPNNAHLSI